MNHESVDLVETESTILEGDEVEVMADHHLCLEGFLKANRGEALQVLSVERGKILCRKTANGEAGWLRRAYVSAPQRRVGDLLLVGKMEKMETESGGACAAPSSFCASGDILELLTEGKDHRLWCRNLDGRCGWISLENFSKKLSEIDATPWKKLVSSPLQLPQPHRKVKTKTELMPFPSMGRKQSWQSYEFEVSEGEVAEILEQSDAFTKVMMCSRNPQVIGWVPTKCLSSQPVVQTQTTQPIPTIPQQLPHHRGLQTIPETGDSSGSDVRSERLIPEVHLEGRSPVTPVSQQWTGTTREAEPAEPEPQSAPVESWIEAAEASLRTPSASQGNLDARPDQGRIIHVSSFGLETLDRELTWQCNHLGGGARCTIPEKDIAAALRRVQGGGAGAENLLILDARPFPDPNSWVLSQLGHSGRHHQIVGSLCHHRNFWYWLRDVKRRFQKELEKSGDISVAIYCKRGKHRSVAAAVILRHIFQSEGYQCSNAWHMSYKQWTFCCYLDCDVCCNPPEEMQTHLDMALDYWRKI